MDASACSCIFSSCQYIASQFFGGEWMGGGVNTLNSSFQTNDILQENKIIIISISIFNLFIV